MEIREVSHEVFYPLFEEWRPKVFQDSLYFYSRDVRTPHEISQFQNLKNGMNPRYELYLVMYEGEELVGWSSSFQVSMGELYMMNSAILPKFRKKGHYKALMNRTIEIATEKGFQQITSQHVCSNNDVIIPKLKAGFNIVGTEISDQFGVFVKLAYYINPMRKQMYEFRSGSKRPTQEIEAVFAKYIQN